MKMNNAQQQRQRTELRTMFDSVDTSGDGSIDVEELGLLLQTLGQQFTQAELRDTVRQLDQDGSGSIEFEEFALLVTKWQEAELRDVFAYFDGDDSGDIGLVEFRSALQALGQELTTEQVNQLTSDADLDKSGHIDVTEFCAFMQPYMCITKRYEYTVRRDGKAVQMHVHSMGVQLKSGEGTTQTDETIGFARISAFEATKEGGGMLTLSVEGDGSSEVCEFMCQHAETIVTVMKQQVAKQDLRRQVALNKQKLELLAAFRLVDVSGDGMIDLPELRALLLSLGQSYSVTELRDIMSHSTDASPRSASPRSPKANSSPTAVGTNQTRLIDFHVFSELMMRFQQEELRDAFAFFDDDGSGCISVAELSAAIQALGEFDGSADEADQLAAYVDSNGSGTIDIDEFCVFLKPMMSVTQRHEYSVQYADVEPSQVKFVVSVLGVQMEYEDGQVTPINFYQLIGIKESDLVGFGSPFLLRLVMTFSRYYRPSTSI